MTINFDSLLENYPDDLDAALESTRIERDELAQIPGLEFVAHDLDRWPSHDVVTVAFLDGTDDLHAAVASTTQAITAACCLRLDFGHDQASNSFRRWALSDDTYAADIRVSFDLPGYWSLVGMSSIDSDLVPPSLDAGGAPHQRSLNLGGFDQRLPTNWRRIVLHEFLHALAFAHEHQNPLSECQSDFRWDDDPDYEPTTDGSGRYSEDVNGRRPGIYTFLSGPPNNWDKAKIDRNLRPDPENSTVQSNFDGDSVMLYRFPPIFYKRNPSPCAPTTEGDTLSEGDVRGLQLLYPETNDSDRDRLDAAEAAQPTLSTMANLESNTALVGPGLINRINRLRARANA